MSNPTGAHVDRLSELSVLVELQEEMVSVLERSGAPERLVRIARAQLLDLRTEVAEIEQRAVLGYAVGAGVVSVVQT